MVESARTFTAGYERSLAAVKQQIVDACAASAVDYTTQIRRSVRTEMAHVLGAEIRAARLASDATAKRCEAAEARADDLAKRLPPSDFVGRLKWLFGR